MGNGVIKKKSDCFNIIANNGLIIYETPTGDFRSGIEIISYDKKKGVIKWELIKAKRLIHLRSSQKIG